MLLVLTSFCAAATENRESNIDEIRRSIVTLIGHNRDGSYTKAAGFFISEDGLIASTRHAVADASELIAVAADGEKFTVEGIAAEDPTHDLVILRVLGRRFSASPAGTSEHIAPDIKVTIIADRGLHRDGAVRGTVERVENLGGDYRWFLVNASIRDGDSGTPVIDEKGRVIGMARAALSKYSKAFVIPVERVTKLLPVANDSLLKPIRSLQERPDELFDDLDFKAALAAMSRGDNAEAIRRMAFVSSRFPDSSACDVLVGSFLSRLLDWKKASDSFQKAASKNPDNALAWACLGAASAFAGNLNDATKSIEKAVALGAHDPDSLFNIGLVHFKANNLAALRDIVQRLEAMEDPAARGVANRLRLGMKTLTP